MQLNAIRRLIVIGGTALSRARSGRHRGMGAFRYEGHRIEYDSYGEGERLLVLVHGLLMNRRMFERLAPALARRGNRVVCVDLLGHGRSDRPEDLRLYSMPLFARQVAALLDHLEQTRRWSAGPRWAPTSRSSWRCAIRSGSAASSSRCRCSTTPCPRWPAPSRRSCSACGSAGRFRARLPRHLGDPPHQLPGRHRPGLGAPAARALGRGAGGPAAGGDGAAPGGAAAGSSSRR